MFDIHEALRNLPDHPGVYIMKDSTNEVIYVGKAISLKNRVSQYFQSIDRHAPKVRAMVQKIDHFEYILTGNELEALILECNLIKKYRPKYNILLKDDKHYPYVRIDMNEDYPYVTVTRSIKNDKAKYFGPFIGANAIRDTIDVIKKIFPIRTCRKHIEEKSKVNERPCLNYYIKKCLAPCQGKISSSDYKQMIQQICSFLNGKNEELLKELERKMTEASDKLDFEKAALYRDRIKAIEKVAETQKAISTQMLDQDIIAFADGFNDTVAQILYIRKGKLIGTESFVLSGASGNEKSEITNSFLKQYYMDANFIPSEVIIQYDVEDIDVSEKWLSDKKGRKVKIIVPKQGEKKKLVDMAYNNAVETEQKMILKQDRDYQKTEGSVKKLAEYLELDNPPQRIEGFDISNIQGTESVASMVVFENGKPKKSDYRRFKIKTVVGPNDFASMAEVIGRRFKRGINEIKERNIKDLDVKEGKFSHLPDLLLIDGGKGQLHAAREVLKSLGLSGIPTIGLAKRLEEIYVEGRNDPIIISHHSDALHILQQVRDEAHRFAITYHRSLRKRSRLHSELDDIKGIGQQRKKALLRHFNSIDEIKNSTVSDLEKIEFMNSQASKAVYDYFHKKV